MKIVSDFDGVLTDIASEAQGVEEWFIKFLSDYAFLPQTAVSSIVKQHKEKMEANPFSHGWKWNGRISAFASEDGFIHVNALAAALDETAEAGDRQLLKGREFLPATAIHTYQDLAQRAYQTTTEETARGAHQPMEKAAVEAIANFIREGATVVVVSNSQTERIQHLLASQGLGISERLRVRGNAGKFKLGTGSRPLNFEGVSFDTDRPLYEAILSEEKPDHIFGDVFSLDLALPLYLRRKEKEGLRGCRIWLRSRSYTPTWAKRLFSEAIKPSEGGLFESFRHLDSRRLSQ